LAEERAGQALLYRYSAKTRYWSLPIAVTISGGPGDAPSNLRRLSTDGSTLFADSTYGYSAAFLYRP
jgi:hypothetical protein